LKPNQSQFQKMHLETTVRNSFCSFECWNRWSHRFQNLETDTKPDLWKEID